MFPQAAKVRMHEKCLLQVRPGKVCSPKGSAQPSQDKLCQVKWEIVCISFMHHFHPQIGTIQDVLPAIDDMTLCVQHTLVEVEAIQVKGHRANTQGSEPNAK